MDSEPLIGIEIYNGTATKLLLWIELCCQELELTPDTEYRLESPETEYRIEFSADCITLYYQHGFGVGPRILKRSAPKQIKNPVPWEMIVDY